MSTLPGLGAFFDIPHRRDWFYQCVRDFSMIILSAFATLINVSRMSPSDSSVTHSGKVISTMFAIMTLSHLITNIVEMLVEKCSSVPQQQRQARAMPTPV